ncbi:MFS sugar transporter-like protein [Zopfochytrium polystomum]|nr:MFS sugar transporter-like protein [Zopfochytrium polystomum]
MGAIPRSRLLYAYFVCISTSLCMFMYGYDASTFNATNTSPSWNAAFGNTVDSKGKPAVSSDTVGLVGVGYSCGAVFTGFFVAPILSDRFGRRLPMFIGALLIIGFTFVQTFSPTFAIHVLGRTGVGLGQGLMLPSGPVYMGEMAPVEIRGTMMSLWQLMYSVGAFFSYLVALFMGWHSELGDWQWRMVLILQVVSPAVFIFTVWMGPESPRWLIYNGRNDEARAVLAKLRSDEDVDRELEEISEYINAERANNPGAWAVYQMLFTKANMLKRLAMAIFINFSQQTTGQNSLNSYSSKIYNKIFNNQNTTNIINVVNSICGILFTLNSTIFVDRLGRITILVVGALGMGTAMLIVSIVGITTEANGTLYQMGTGIGLVSMFFVFIFFYKPSWGATVWIYTGEIFPMTVRAQAVGIASQTQNVASVALSYLFPVMLTNLGWKTFFVFMAYNYFIAVICYFFYPETKGVTLEDMDALFDGKPASVAVVEQDDEKKV